MGLEGGEAPMGSGGTCGAGCGGEAMGQLGIYGAVGFYGAEGDLWGFNGDLWGWGAQWGSSGNLWGWG